MGDIEKSTTDAVLSLREQLTDMKKNLRLFSLSVKSLYAQNAVGSKAAASEKFRKLRDETRNDAVVYLKGILPLSTQFATSISDFFLLWSSKNGVRCFPVSLKKPLATNNFVKRS